MAGAMRKMGVYLGLVEDDEPITGDADDAGEAYQSDYRRDGYRSEGSSGYGDSSYADSGYSDSRYEHSDYSGTSEPAASVPARRESSSARTAVSAGYVSRTATATQAAPHTSPWSEGRMSTEHDRAHDRALEQAAAMARITTVHPRTYNEARTIGEQFRSGTPVIMNLTEMDDSDAKRLVDFAAGLTFGLRGSIDRVTNRVFLLSPHNVDVTAEDKARIAEGGFFNQS